MRLMGLESVAPKPNTSRQRKGHKVFPYLLKKMSITEPDQVWCSDITYIRLAHGFVYLTAVGVQISMDGKGSCMNNIFIERLWGSVKYEKIFLEEFETVQELLSVLKEYFEFYNIERPHQSLAGKTPAEIYWGRDVVKKAA